MFVSFFIFCFPTANHPSIHLSSTDFSNRMNALILNKTKQNQLPVDCHLTLFLCVSVCLEQIQIPVICHLPMDHSKMLTSRAKVFMAPLVYQIVQGMYWGI